MVELVPIILVVVSVVVDAVDAVVVVSVVVEVIVCSPVSSDCFFCPKKFYQVLIVYFSLRFYYSHGIVKQMKTIGP